MKKLILLLICLLKHFIAQTQHEPKLDNTLSSLLIADSILNQREVTGLERCQIKDKLGVYYYEKDYLKAIYYFENAAKCYEKQQHRLEGNSYLNIAAIYDEKLGNNQKAILYLNQSLKVGEKYDDVLHQATVLKYLGVLKSKNQQFEEGKQDIQKAYQLFKSQGFDRGIAVCFYDLALINFNEKQLDLCLTNLKKAKALQENFNNVDRIFGINNFMMRVYLQQGKLTLVDKINLENQENLYHKKVRDFDRLEYYKVMVVYNELLNNQERKAYYQSKILELKKLTDQH